jgi:hypothetical protein
MIIKNMAALDYEGIIKTANMTDNSSLIRELIENGIDLPILVKS